MEDLEDGLDLVSKGALKPQVETGELDDFPEVLERLHNGKIRSRIVLIPKHGQDSQPRVDMQVERRVVSKIINRL